MKLITIVGWLLITFSVCAEEPNEKLGRWTDADTYRQTAVTALLVADWWQTRYAMKDPCVNAGGGTNCSDPYREVGMARLFIGSHPSVGQVNNYMAASIVGHAAVSYLLPPKWREVWQYVWIGIEVDVVRRNYIGFKYGF